MSSRLPVGSSTFVLVPGAWHGGWCFREVADLLRAEEHTVFPLTSTGLGERAHLAGPQTDLSTHIADVVGTIDAEELTDVILLGHSYGGCIISGVARERPDALRALIYLDAIVLADGECLFDHLSDEFKAGVVDGANRSGGGYMVPIPTMEFLAVGKEQEEWMLRRLTPQPLRTATERLSLPPADRRHARHYIACDQPSIPPTHLSKQRVRAEPDWTVHELQSGHDSFVTDAVALAQLLCHIATV